MSTYYDSLEIEENATSVEIRQAFRRLALRWHPDKNTNNTEEANRRFKEISEAYEVLSDSGKRQIYDTQLDSGEKNIEREWFNSEEHFGVRTPGKGYADYFHYIMETFYSKPYFEDANHINVDCGCGCNNTFYSTSTNNEYCSCEISSFCTSTCDSYSNDDAMTNMCNCCSNNSLIDNHEEEYDNGIGPTISESTETIEKVSQGYCSLCANGQGILINAEPRGIYYSIQDN